MKMWICRSIKGSLCLYDKKPIKQDDKIFIGMGYNYYFIDEALFPEVTFENSPMEVELVIKK